MTVRNPTNVHDASCILKSPVLLASGKGVVDGSVNRGCGDLLSSPKSIAPSVANRWRAGALPGFSTFVGPDAADLKPSGDWNGAGASGQCEELQAELGCRPRVTVQNMRDSGRIRWLIDG